MPANTIWKKEEVGTNRTSKAEIKRLFPDKDPFATPKPEKLLERIIHVGSNPGDIVVDCFVGSGTTTAVAHKVGRRWVAIEASAETLVEFSEPRLSTVVDGPDDGGVSEQVGWEGGGGFRILDVAPSMFEAVDGVVYLADYLTNDALPRPPRHSSASSIRPILLSPAAKVAAA